MSIPRLPGMPRGPRGPTRGSLRQRPSVYARMTPAPEPTRGRPYPAPPADWPDSEGTWAIYWAHGTGRLDRGPEGEVWAFQRPFLGRIWSVGFVPDFTEYDLNVSIDIIDPRRSGGLQQARAIQQLRAVLMQRFGFQHVTMREETATLNPIWALREAMSGRSPDGGLG